MDEDGARRAARQHAETARLLGVDFVPMYRLPPDGTASGPAPVAPMAPIIEAKPADVLYQRAALPVGSKDKLKALDALRARYELEAPHKGFVTAFTNIVFGEGDPNARLVFIGEAPGEEEDRTGRPFVGRSGDLLTKMITAMGLSREQVYICNLLKTRPLNNATPTPAEAAACAPYLFEQIEIINPDAIVTLGLPAAKAVLQCDGTMGGLRSRWGNMLLPGGTRIPVMPTYHPAYLLRNYNPETRAKVWADLQLVMDKLGLKPAATPTPPPGNGPG